MEKKYSLNTVIYNNITESSKSLWIKAFAECINVNVNYIG